MDQARETRARIQSWVTNHFSVTNHEGNVISLLRAVANTLEAVGPAEVHDITFTYDGADVDDVTMTVYLTFAEPDGR